MLTVKEVANFLRVSERWVQKHMKDGTFPFDWLPVAERNHVVAAENFDKWLKKTMMRAGTAPVPAKSKKKLKKKLLKKEASA